MCFIGSGCFLATWTNSDTPTPFISRNVTERVFGDPLSVLRLPLRRSWQGNKAGPMAVCPFLFTALPLRNPSHCASLSIQNTARAPRTRPVARLLRARHGCPRRIMEFESILFHGNRLESGLEKNEWFMNKRLVKLYSVLHSKITLNLPNKYIAFHWLGAWALFGLQQITVFCSPPHGRADLLSFFTVLQTQGG